MKAAYVNRFRLSDRFAYVVTSSKSTEALVKQGFETELFLPWRYKSSSRKTAGQLQQFRADMGLEEEFGVRFIPWIHFQGRLSRSFAYSAALTARRLKLDLLWSRDFHAGIAAAKLGVPTVIEHHVLLPERWLPNLDFTQNYCSRILFVAISQAHRKLLMEQGIPDKQLMVAPLGVSLSEFDLPASSVLDEWKRQGTTILYAGSLYRGRGIDLIFETARQLPTAQFIVIGGRPSDLELQKQELQRLQLPNVHLLGAVPRSQVPTYLKSADILIAPYTEECEAVDGRRIVEFFSPTKLFEYMAAGKPVVSTGVGAVPEIVKDGINGLLVDPTAGGLTDGIKRLLANPNLRNTLMMGALQTARSHTWDARAAHVVARARELWEG